MSTGSLNSSALSAFPPELYYRRANSSINQSLMGAKAKMKDGVLHNGKGRLYRYHTIMGHSYASIGLSMSH